MNTSKESEVREATLEERLITLEERLIRIHSTLFGPTVREENVENEEKSNQGVVVNLFQHLNECDFLANQIEDIVAKIRN